MSDTVTTTSKDRARPTSNTGEARTREQAGQLKSDEVATERQPVRSEQTNPAEVQRPPVVPQNSQLQAPVANGTIPPVHPKGSPLEAPRKERVDVVTPETPTAPAVGVQLVGAPSSRVLDALTKESPDFDQVVEKVEGPGDLYRVTTRLVQEVHYGPHAMPSRQLVMPEGTVLGGAQLAELKSRVQAQESDGQGTLTTRDSDPERGAVSDTQIESTDPKPARSTREEQGPATEVKKDALSQSGPPELAKGDVPTPRDAAAMAAELEPEGAQGKEKDEQVGEQKAADQPKGGARKGAESRKG